MKRIVVSYHRQSREHIANPNVGENLSVRLKKSGCVKHGKNKTVKDLGNGYSKIISKKRGKP